MLSFKFTELFLSILFILINFLLGLFLSLLQTTSFTFLCIGHFISGTFLGCQQLLNTLSLACHRRIFEIFCSGKYFIK
uniref:Putative secreted protein n=1 Tax=Panstrongylus lignarius TaxID=156445 RepID=A0A224XWW3_9HEMI